MKDQLLDKTLTEVHPRDSNLTGESQESNPSIAYLLERIKSPKNKSRINTAREQERRIRLHTVGTQDSSTAYVEWETKIKKLLPPQKFTIFKELITEPVPTLDLTETIFDELAKIFEASNKSIYCSFEKDTEKYSEKFKKYKDLERYFKTEVYDMFKVAPNSFLVVDTKLEGDSEGLTQPITYFVHLDSIIDFDTDRDGKTNYILFKASDDKIVGIDKNNYYVFEKERETTSNNTITSPLSDYKIKAGYPSPHNLKDTEGRPYTPAFMIYPDFLNVTDNVVVNSPLTKSLGNLDWLLFWSISKRYLDLYAPFPIYVSFEEDCTYVHPSGAMCENGYIRLDNENSLEEQAQTIPCPHCSRTRLFGAGSTIEVPAPQTKDEPNLINAVNVIPAEDKSLKYVTEELDRLEQKIYYSVLGKTSQPIENFSQSIAQLDLSTESRKAVLIHIKEMFETTHYWVLYTMGKLRYGDQFKDCNVNYGDNYFLTTQEQETDKYKKLKDTGAPESILHSSLESIISTTYKTSPHTRLLQQIYLEVEPYQTQSLEDVMKLSAQGLIPRESAIAKIHFTDFIEEYENGHRSIVSEIENGRIDKHVVVKALKTALKAFVKKIVKDIDEQMPEPPEETTQTTKSPDLTKPTSKQKRTIRDNQEEK